MRAIDWNELVGRRLSGIRLIGDEIMCLDFEDGTVTLDTEADCCSQTWFADIIDPGAVLGEILTGAGYIELPKDLPERVFDEGRTRQESDSFYGFELRSARGRCIVAYRNSSNGYYGGSIARSDRTPDGGRQITEDYST